MFLCGIWTATESGQFECKDDDGKRRELAVMMERLGCYVGRRVYGRGTK